MLKGQDGKMTELLDEKARSAEDARRDWMPGWARRLLSYRESGVFIALILLVAIMFVVSPTFRQPENIQIISMQMATIAIMAMGQTLVIISGAFDLSQTAVCALVAMVAGILWANDGLPPIAAIVIALAVGAVAGLANGVLAARLKLHPIVMTLATSTIFTGVTYVLTQGNPVIGLPSLLLDLGSGSLGPIPVSVVVMLIVAAGMQILLTRTLFGLRVRQMGGNLGAARLVGVNVRRVWTAVFVVSGLLAGLGGIVELGQVGNALPTIGSTLLFPVISAAIIGGTLLSGGEGSMIGTLLGAAVLTVINDALVVLSVNDYWQDVVEGSLVVAALLVDQIRRGNLNWRTLIREEL
jgi:ribose transport system permease protein